MPPLKSSGCPYQKLIKQVAIATRRLLKITRRKQPGAQREDTVTTVSFLQFCPIGHLRPAAPCGEVSITRQRLPQSGIARVWWQEPLQGCCKLVCLEGILQNPGEIYFLVVRTLYCIHRCWVDAAGQQMGTIPQKSVGQQEIKVDEAL